MILALLGVAPFVLVLLGLAPLFALPELDSPAGADDEGAALALQPGNRVNGYVLVSRVRSLPSTFAPSEVARPTVEDIEEAASWLLPDLFGANHTTGGLALAEPEGTAASSAPLGLPEGHSASAPPLGLPSPFEAELALASASSKFRLHRRVQRGHHGEVWRAVRYDDPSQTPLVLKRMTLEVGGKATLRSGLRERHFGRMFRGHSSRIARYIDTFEEASSL